MKRGIEILIGLIVLVAIVLVVAAVAFFSGNFPTGTSSYKPDSASVQCKYFCDTNQKSGFCSFDIKVTDSLTTTCEELVSSSKYSQYNVSPCPSISCEASSTLRCVEDLGAQWETPVDGNCPAGNGLIGRQITSTDSPPQSGEICCR